MVLLLNINYLISKQKNSLRIDPNMFQKVFFYKKDKKFFKSLRQKSLLHKQSFVVKYVNRYINTSTAINCIYSLVYFSSDTNILNKFSCLVCTWLQHLLINSKDSELYWNFHPIKSLLTFAWHFAVFTLT